MPWEGLQDSLVTLQKANSSRTDSRLISSQSTSKHLRVAIALSYLDSLQLTSTASWKTLRKNYSPEPSEGEM